MPIKFVCYDNEGATTDRYTIFPRNSEFDACAIRQRGGRPLRMSLGLSDQPGHPLGFSQWTHAQAGPHLGRKIQFDSLPEMIRAHAIKRCA